MATALKFLLGVENEDEEDEDDIDSDADGEVSKMFLKCKNAFDNHTFYTKGS